jgi:hypothetical protein
VRPSLLPSLAPIIDLRAEQPRHRQWPAELGTLTLWGCWGLMLGGVAAPLGMVALAALWRFGRSWSHPLTHSPTVALSPVARPLPPALIQSSAVLGHSAMAHHFGLRDVDLFRAQHAQVCTVHHTAEGKILHIECLKRAEAPAAALPDRHAHPVG